MIKIIRHAFALIREDKLFSAIYVAGTAVAIASAMVVALILHIRISNIYPEEHRDRTVYLTCLCAHPRGQAFLRHLHRGHGGGHRLGNGGGAHPAHPHQQYLS